MPLDNTYRAYGQFLVTWNSLQPVLDAAIVREAGLTPQRGAIVVAALTTRSRLSVLRGLLQAAGGEKADVVPLLAEIAQALKKQPLVTGHASVASDDSLLLTRPEMAGRLASSAAEYSADEIDALTEELAAHVRTLTSALAIEPADIEALKRASEETVGRRRKDVEEE